MSEKDAAARPRTEGRPDLRDHSFGKSRLKRFPPYVYSLQGGMLVHRVQSVEAHWYVPVLGGECLERLESPRLIIHVVCGQWFFGGHGLDKRSRACVLPRPGAVECGRCAGTGAVFGRGLTEMAVRRLEARRRIGCVQEVSDVQS